MSVLSVVWNGDRERSEARTTGRLFNEAEGNEFVPKWWWQWQQRGMGGVQILREDQQVPGRSWEGSLTPEVQSSPKVLFKSRQAQSERGRGRSSRREGPLQLCFTSVCWSVNILLGKPFPCLRELASCAQCLALRVRIENLYANYLARLQARIGAGRFLSRVCYCCTW